MENPKTTRMPSLRGVISSGYNNNTLSKGIDPEERGKASLNHSKTKYPIMDLKEERG
jgi:hypothetical protein